MSLLTDGLESIEKKEDIRGFLEISQKYIDATVTLKARNQVQLVRFIYEQSGIDGIVSFYRSEIVPWAERWAKDILKREGLEPGSVTALKALELYEEVHKHTTLCSDSLGMFVSVAHADYVLCGANHCPAARGWMEIWPEGAHLLCFLYSFGFDTVFFRTLNQDLYFSKHAECCQEQPGLPHGKLCIMEINTAGKELSQEEIQKMQIPGAQPDDITVSEKTTSLLKGKNIQYVPHVPLDILKDL